MAKKPTLIQQAYERAKQAREYLSALDGRCLTVVEEKERFMEFWAIRGKVVILIASAHGGWEIYRPLADTNSATDTLKALEEYVHA